jgi:hypothetical protein
MLADTDTSSRGAEEKKERKATYLLTYLVLPTYLFLRFFELVMQRNGQKRGLKKIEGGKRQPRLATSAPRRRQHPPTTGQHGNTSRGGSSRSANRARPQARPLEEAPGIKSQLFWQTVFDMDFPQKAICGVFELPLLRNAQKCH